jgi:tetratricopeptide (TPR) repeat protein
LIRRIMTGYEDAGGVIGLPLFSTMRAEILLALGESEAAVAEMQRAREAVRRTGELFFEPLVLLVLGQCLLAEARFDEARTCLEEVLSATGRMGATLFERRAREMLSSLNRNRDLYHELS